MVMNKNLEEVEVANRNFLHPPGCCPACPASSAFQKSETFNPLKSPLLSNP